jgi:hypothetical protein
MGSEMRKDSEAWGGRPEAGRDGWGFVGRTFWAVFAVFGGVVDVVAACCLAKREKVVCAA